jgi:lactoylglutathione lyase
MPRAKIRHIAISTDDPERTAAWYKEIFGLEEVGKSPVGVYLSDGTINLAVLRIPSPSTGEPVRGVHHFGFVVDAAEPVYAHLESLGTKRLPDVPLGNQYFEVKWEGPDGVCVDVVEHGWVGAKGLDDAVPDTIPTAT